MSDEDDRKPDPMDVPAVLKALNKALALQQRSALQYTMASGSMFGLQAHGLTAELWTSAQADLADAKALVEKITALGGDPTTEIATLDWASDPQQALDSLADQEDECIAALHAVIPHTGQEPRSEALEHLMEHLIMRKQQQVDALRRALRTG